MAPSEHPLEPSPEQLLAWIDAFARFAVGHLARMPELPARGLPLPEARARAQEVRVPIGEDPRPGGVAEIIERLGRALEASIMTTSSGYLGYVPGGGLPVAAVADLVGDLLNRQTGVEFGAPALVRLEADVLQWLTAAFGYDARARGLLCSGGSLANLSAVATARLDRLGEAADLRQAVAYTSSQAHHSVGKALRLSGLPAASLRTVAVDERLRLRVDELSRQVEADRAAGRLPFLVISAAGTTNTGAIDPLPELATLCEREGLWHHVDAAYGGGFVLCDEGRERLRGIERADSITFDPHKGMFLPYGTGCLLVRDGAALRRAHSLEAAYLKDFADDPAAAPSPADHGPELSRPFRGLRLWLALMLHGAAPFRRALTEKLALARRFHQGLVELVAAGAPVEVVDDPQLTVVPFRLRRREGEPRADHDARNAAWLRAINERGRVFLSSTTLPSADGPAATLRVCVLSFRTHAADIERALEDVAQTIPG